MHQSESANLQESASDPNSADDRSTSSPLHKHRRLPTLYVHFLHPLWQRELRRSALPPTQNDNILHNIPMRDCPSTILALGDGNVVRARVVEHELYQRASV